MNYRHAYHAGNAADVLKHIVLSFLVKRLTAKAKPLFVLDTHAGRGLYDLDGMEAKKTLEASAGILKLWRQRARLEEIAPDFTQILDALNPDGNLRHYPGSPRLIASLLRPDDRLVLCEKHAEEAAALRSAMINCPQASVHARDGWEGISAFVPPAERRGLVLVDPPYEEADEWAKLPQRLLKGIAKWPQGCYALWYPVKDRAPLWEAESVLMQSAAIANMLQIEVMWEPVEDAERLTGSGLIIVNPPYGLAAECQQKIGILAEALAGPQGHGKLGWLKGGE